MGQVEGKCINSAEKKQKSKIVVIKNTSNKRLSLIFPKRYLKYQLAKIIQCFSEKTVGRYTLQEIINTRKQGTMLCKIQWLKSLDKLKYLQIKRLLIFQVVSFTPLLLQRVEMCGDGDPRKRAQQMVLEIVVLKFYGSQF